MSPKNLNVSNKTHKNLLNKLRDKRIFQIYRKFENILKLNQDFIVGVSGGPDSLALCFLSKIYSIKKSCKAHCYIVDHRLRKNSSSEAQSVKKLLKKYNIKSDILKWYGKKPISNIQSLARNKRYSLLINQAKKLNIKTILTGHHVDDLYENFFIRISRGSGLNGLVSFSEKTQTNKVNILRPLISFEKKQLNYVSTKVFKSYVKDPSNDDNKFKRVRVRKLIKSLQNDGLDKNKFLLTIKNLKDSNQTIRFYVAKNLRDNSCIYKDKSKIILNKEFFNQPHEVTFRSLTEIIKFVGDKYYSVRGKKIDSIIDKIKDETRSSLKLTLGNCIIYKVNQSIIVVKEQ
ncbi:tRNA lysidine(34) synthetase TilS [Candidatus Pelagibacter sp.]|nr:tRNA lysidine(34) synthetase TilS [Candidatus Pelagibacter sp.]